MSENARLNSLLDLLKESPKDGFLLFAVAKEYEGAGLFSEAQSYYENLMEIDPNYVGLYFHLGALLQEGEELEAALEIYEKGIKVATDIHDLHALSELKGAKMNLEMEM